MSLAKFRTSVIMEELRKFDRFHHAATMISDEHRLTHDGMIFYVDGFEPDIPDGQTRLSLFRTGAKPVHFKRMTISASEGPVVVTLSENAVVDVLGTQETLRNANRLSSNTPLTTWYSQTTFTAIGDPLLANLYIPANGNSGVTGSTGAVEELVLKPNTDHSFTFTNDPAGQGSADVSFIFVFYELDYQV